MMSAGTARNGGPWASDSGPTPFGTVRAPDEAHERKRLLALILLAGSSSFAQLSIGREGLGPRLPLALFMHGPVPPDLITFWVDGYWYPGRRPLQVACRVLESSTVWPARPGLGRVMREGNSSRGTGTASAAGSNTIIVGTVGDHDRDFRPRSPLGAVIRALRGRMTYECRGRQSTRLFIWPGSYSNGCRDADFVTRVDAIIAETPSQVLLFSET